VKEQSVTVTVVLDPEYGDRMLEAAIVGPVWLTSGAANRAAAENYWRTRANRSANVVTYWSAQRTGRTTGEWLSILDDLDLHHPGFDSLHVIGIGRSEAATAALQEFDFEVVGSEPSSFRAIRRSSSA
jgi:hypothetical protein